jgi:4-alpha-glucanotransferase
MLRGLTIGAPPDLINTSGQDWGVTTFSPSGLIRQGFSGFIELLRSSMRHAGGVRIDHVMGLARLWVVPRGMSAAQGAYLRFPLDDLLRLVKIESRRHRAIVLGEDLGTLPDGFRERLQDAGLAGLRVLWFERDTMRFLPPQQWSGDAVAMTSTHDLSTVAGWWQGRDLEWRAKLTTTIEDEDTIRNHDRAALWDAFRASGSAHGEMPASQDSGPVADAAAAHIGHAACQLAILPIEDALALPEQPNLPGTIDEHPNWRRRLAAPADALLRRPDVASRLAALHQARLA